MPQTWYHTTAPSIPAFPPLAENARAEVCIIGAGLTGISAALTLAQRGFRVIVINDGKIGDGASGRNGGQVHSGHRREQGWLEQKCGRETAQALWRMAEDAKAHLHHLIARHAIDCDWVPGLILADHKPRHARHTLAYVDHLRAHYNYTQIHYLEPDDIRARINSPYYYSGVLDEGAGHLHPLKLVFGLVRAAVAVGVTFYENTEAVRLRHETPLVVETAQGELRAEWVLLAGDAMMDGLDNALDTRILPIASTIGVTEPLDMSQLFSGKEAVSDSRFIVNYFRPVAGNRLLFGGGESWSITPVWNPERNVRRAMAAVFPQLASVRFESAWSGLVGITPTRVPFVRKMARGVIAAAGYSGHGLALAPYFGHILAEAIAGNLEKFDLLSHLPVPAFPGGILLRRPLLMAAMSYYALRDRF
jgi:gamma-glutamylputrescine oxidase